LLLLGDTLELEDGKFELFIGALPGFCAEDVLCYFAGLISHVETEPGHLQGSRGLWQFDPFPLLELDELVAALEDLAQ
jgi:hypothetical protein